MYLFVSLFALVFFSAGGSASIISGQDDFIFEYDAHAFQDTLFSQITRAQLLNGHGLCKDLEGNVYFTFQPAKVDPTTQALVVFSLATKAATLIGDPQLSIGTPHGLRIEHDPKVSQSFLYHANNAAIVTKTTLTGKIVWMSNFSSWRETHPQYWPLAPTDAVVVPGTDLLLLADGYGSSYIHMLDKNSGQYLGKSWAGKGRANAPIKFTTPHGINYDPYWNSDKSQNADPVFVVSDRSNNRLVWTTADGTFISEQSFAKSPPFGMSLPCNVDMMVDPITNQTVSVIPSLGDSYDKAYINGSVVVYGKGNQDNLAVLSVIEVEKLLGTQGHQHPHDAIMLNNGDLVICCWSGPSDGPEFGPAKGTISYWERVPKAKSNKL